MAVYRRVDHNFSGRPKGNWFQFSLKESGWRAFRHGFVSQYELEALVQTWPFTNEECPPSVINHCNGILPIYVPFLQITVLWTAPFSPGVSQPATVEIWAAIWSSLPGDEIVKRTWDVSENIGYTWIYHSLVAISLRNIWENHHQPAKSCSDFHKLSIFCGGEPTTSCDIGGVSSNMGHMFEELGVWPKYQWIGLRYSLREKLQENHRYHRCSHLTEGCPVNFFSLKSIHWN